MADELHYEHFRGSNHKPSMNPLVWIVAAIIIAFAGFLIWSLVQSDAGQSEIYKLTPTPQNSPGQAP